MYKNVKNLLMIILFLQITIILNADGRYNRTRMLTWLDSQSSYSVSSGESSTWSIGTYFYNPNSFYEEDYRTYHQEVENTGGHTTQEWIAPISGSTTINSGFTTIDMIHYDQQNYFASLERLVVDPEGRKILYQNLDESSNITYNESLSYGDDDQLDNIIINSNKWVFTYDEFGRKTRIEKYTGSGFFDYLGYYELVYDSIEPFPATLDFTLSYNNTIQEMRTLFDPNYKFDQIIFHPDGQSPEDTHWVCSIGDSITFSKTLGDPESDYYAYYSYTCSNDGNLKAYHRNLIEYDNVSSRDDYYTWFTETVSVNDEVSPLPDITLEQNFPNPFNAKTSFKYRLSKNGPVCLRVFNLRGQLINTLYQGNKTSGEYSCEWSGVNEEGIQVSSGVYFIRLQSGDGIRTMKIVKTK